jgi:hypothetical protein
MKKFYIFTIALLVTLATSAQTINSTDIDISAIEDSLTLEAIDVAACTSKLASPALWYDNPFKGQTFDTAEISFDVFNYGDIHVLGSLVAFFDADSGQGRMYFTNGSYLGYNAMGGWFDANLVSYALDSNFIGNNTWKNVRLQFTATGYAMYVDDVLAYDQNSSDVTIAGTLTDYSNVITYLQKADTMLIGTGSWWSDNQDAQGNYYDIQYSYLKNITFITKDGTTPDSTDIDIDAVAEELKFRAIDVAACASKLANPDLWYDNPFKGDTFDVAEISFDVFNYGDIHVLGSLVAFRDFDSGMGRMYFTNGSYLGYNAMGGWYDANLISYALGTDFLGIGEWKNVKLRFSKTGYAMYVDDVLAYNQNSTDITIAGTLTDHSNVMSYLQIADTLVIGTGSWWSDNQDAEGNYYDIQYSFLKNITLSAIEYPELMTGGNMEDSTAWITYWRSDNVDVGTFEFNYTGDVPTAGDGGCLKINSYGNSGAFAKQAVTITPGHAYRLTGAFKNISTDAITNSWVELILTRKEPIEDMEFNAGDSYVIFEKNTWMSDPVLKDMDIDGTFEEDFNYRSPSFAAPYSKNFVISDTVTQTEWFILIKAGSSNGNGVMTPNIDYLFDNIALKDLGVDDIAPTAPVNLAANEAGDTITWDASVDNIGVAAYKIYDGETEVKTITAKAAGNLYAFSDLTEGDHTLGVVAVDQSGNESAMSTVDVNIVIESIENNEVDYFSIYPNPSTGIVNIITRTSAMVTLEVYDITGKMIISKDFTKDYQLDLSGAYSGLYFILLKTKDGVQVEKLILQ